MGAPEPLRGAEGWAALPGWQRRAGAALVVLAAAVAAVVLVDRPDEPHSAEVALSGSLGVDTVSNARDGGGRVDHYAVVVNEAAQPVQVVAVRMFEHRLRARSLLADASAVAPGDVAYLPLSVGLDCRRAEPLEPSSTLRGSVEVRTAEGDALLVPVVFSGAEPLTQSAATLCGLDPRLVVGELSGPVRSTSSGEGA